MPFFYKITNKQENHHGYQYVDGLNILTDEFAETGSCCKGGFYFTTLEHIHEYLNFGTYLREVILPTNEFGFKMVANGNEKINGWRSNMIILGKRFLLSDIETIKYICNYGKQYQIIQRLLEQHNGNTITKLLNDKIIDPETIISKHQIKQNPSLVNSVINVINIETIKKLLIDNSIKYNYEVVKFLIKIDNSVSTQALKQVYYTGDTWKSDCKKMIELLICDGNVDLNCALEYAIKYNDYGTVEKLIKNGANNFLSAYRTACDNDHTCIVKLLLRMVSDINTIENFNYGMIKFANKGDFGMVDYFLYKGANDYDSALLAAAPSHNERLIKLLIRKGATTLNEALLISCQFEDYEIISFIINKGANNLNQALAIAQKHNNYKIINFLKKKYKLI